MATSDLCTLLQRHAASASTSTPSSSPYSSSTSHSSNSPHHSHSPLPPSLDVPTERRICTAILALLDDSSNDVQTISVKTLGVLLTIVHEEQVSEICDRLCTLVLDKSKKELRDVYAIGLQTLVKTVPESMGDVVSHRLSGRLLEGIIRRSQQTRSGSTTTTAGQRDGDDDITLCCLDVLGDLLQRFGNSSVLRRDHERLLNACLHLCLAAEGGNGGVRPVVKKRASQTVAYLAVVISDGLLTRLVETLLGRIEGTGGGKGGNVDNTRALIRTMCKISEKVGHRLAGQIDRIVPIFLRFCDPSEAITADDDEARRDEEGGMDEDEEEDALSNGGPASQLSNELRESCFSGFESFVLRCPTEVNPMLGDIIQSALAYVRYDPNYSYGDENDDDNNDALIDEDGSDDDDGSGYSDDDFSDDSEVDDDDDSWKVRRSAVRALIAIVECCKAEPSRLWTDEYRYGSKKKTVAAALVDRFKEREEECRIYIIDCFTRLLNITVAASTAGAIILATPTTIETMDTSSSSSPVHIDLSQTYVPAIIKACQKQLSSKKGGERTKSSALALLSTLCLAPGGIGSLLPLTSVLQHIGLILTTDNSGKNLSRYGGHSTVPKSLKLDALRTVRVILACDRHLKDDLRPGLTALLPQLCSASQDDWYKVIAEALRVLAHVPQFYVEKTADCDSTAVAKQLFDAVKPRLMAHDLDQEIKECSLTAAASLLSVLHPYMTSGERSTLLVLILERLRNETTRLPALKTLATISAGEGSRLDLSPILNDAVQELAALLRQQNRALRQSALEALDIVICSHGGRSMGVDLFDVVLKEFGAIVVDSDLHISHLSLRTSISVLKVCPSSAPSVKTHILPPALALAASPLLQDLALESLLSLLSQLVLTKTIDFGTLHNLLTSQLDTLYPANKQTLANLAKCIATITAATTPQNRDRVVSDLITTMESNTDQLQVHLALLTSGELGRRVDLSATPSVAQHLLKLYLQFFESPSEEMKHAAAYALGQASIGAMPVFLPAILSTLEQISQRKQYLLLSSLKELMKSINPSDLATSEVEQILPHLLNHCADEEEGVRTMVAECLGSLTCLLPQSTLPKLESLIAQNATTDSSPSTHICWTAATSIKFAIANKAKPETLSPYFPKFLSLLSSPSLSVRSAALIMVYSAVHHTPDLVSNVMKDHILPALYNLAQLNLKRVVDLGPFKHTVDDALPLRKSSLSIFATSLENCPKCLDIPAFLPILAKALEDVEDVQLQAHQILITLCLHFPLQIFPAAETFVDPLEKTMLKKKGNKTGTELERENEWIKSALRAMVALSGVEGAMTSKKVCDFVDRVKGNQRLKGMLEAVVDEC